MLGHMLGPEARWGAQELAAAGQARAPGCLGEELRALQAAFPGLEHDVTKNTGLDSFLHRESVCQAS